MKANTLAALVALGALSALPAGAQALIHRYSLNGNANDTVGSAHGSVVGNVTLSSQPGVNGAAVFAGDRSSANPGYVSLPTGAVSGLQNATVEIFTTNFNMYPDSRHWQALFSVGTPYGNQTNYVILAANRADGGIGTGARTNNGPETKVIAHDPLPVWRQNHIVHLVFSGFTGVGSMGTETIYLDGQQVAQGPTVFSFANVAAGAGGIGTVGIGGGACYDDPTFSGSMNEVRIYNGALSPAQITSDVDAGPGVLGFTLPLQVSSPTVSPVTDTQATVGWTSSNVTDTVVDYGATTSYGSTATGVSGKLAHSAKLAGLQPRTLYHYRARSIDIFSQTVTTPDATFTTAAPAMPNLATGKVTLSRDGVTGEVIASVAIANIGLGDASNVLIRSATLGSANTTTALPVSLGKIIGGSSTTATLRFPAQAAGTATVLRVAGVGAGVYAHINFNGGSRVRVP